MDKIDEILEEYKKNCILGEEYYYRLLGHVRNDEIKQCETILHDLIENRAELYDYLITRKPSILDYDKMNAMYPTISVKEFSRMTFKLMDLFYLVDTYKCRHFLEIWYACNFNIKKYTPIYTAHAEYLKSLDMDDIDILLRNRHTESDKTHIMSIIWPRIRTNVIKWRSDCIWTDTVEYRNNYDRVYRPKDGGVIADVISIQEHLNILKFLKINLRYMINIDKKDLEIIDNWKDGFKKFLVEDRKKWFPMYYKNEYEEFMTYL